MCNKVVLKLDFLASYGKVEYDVVRYDSFSVAVWRRHFLPSDAERD